MIEEKGLVWETVDLSNLGEFERYVEAHEKGHFLQSYLWKNQKQKWEWCGLLVKNNGNEICGAMSVLMRRVPGTFFTMMYAARGPVCEIHEKEVLEKLLEGVKSLAKKHHSYVLKIDPDVVWEDKVFSQILEELGFILKKKTLDFQNIQPQYVMRLDLKEKTKEEIFSNFKSKTRYNIRLAIKRGVCVKVCGEEAVEDFHPIMVETGERDGFIIRKKEYFQSMLRNLGKHVRLYMAYYEGKPIAGTIAILYGSKVWYLYGASSNQYRNVMPNYLLQWNMIQWAMEEKCHIYDFRGISGDMDKNNPLYGLYQFKSGWNGVVTEFVGEFHYIFKPIVYSGFEDGIKILRKLRSRCYRLKKKG